MIHNYKNKNNHKFQEKNLKLATRQSTKVDNSHVMKCAILQITLLGEAAISPLIQFQSLGSMVIKQRMRAAWRCKCNGHEAAHIHTRKHRQETIIVLFMWAYKKK